jgi:formylglycine-generating enzyme
VKQFPGIKRDSFDDEQPQRLVRITQRFYFAAHPVTLGQFSRFVESTGYVTEAERGAAGSNVWDGKMWKRDPNKNWRKPGFKQNDDHPVVCVSYNDAMAYIGWLNEQPNEKNRGYRLPTEAEREYACRAGSSGLYGRSDDPESLVRIANFADVSYEKQFGDSTCIQVDDKYVYTAPVGKFEPNAWHLYDMVGNVEEWCNDWYEPKFYQSSPKGNPHYTAKDARRVIRSGSWVYGPWFCRPANRTGSEPDNRNFSRGFRVVAVKE